jgi:FHS family L-fucose permease-like MFS transporter
MKKIPLIPFILVTSLFFMWGLAANMTDTLLAAFKRIMSMTDFQTSWIQFAFYGAYFCLAIPAALFIKRFTYKSGILLGLGLYILGAFLFLPASQTMIYGHFLVALYILAGGLSILETTANPYILALGPEETATKRLNIAQAFNPIGAISGVFLSKVYILSNLNRAGVDERANMSTQELELIQSAELSAVMGPYVGVAVGLIALWLIIAIYKMPARHDEDKHSGIGATFKRLLKRPNYVWGVVAQFFYVGAQIGVWSYTIRYVMQELSLTEAESANYYIASLIVFTAARFLTAFLMNYISERKLISALSVLAIVFTSFTIFGKGLFAVYSLVAISFCMSLMFPTIFGLASEGLGEDRKIGSSGLVMAILGGAVLTGIQGLVSDATGSIKTAFVVPVFCFVVVLFYSLYSGRSNLINADS